MGVKKIEGRRQNKSGPHEKRTYFFVAAAAAVSQIIDLAGLHFQGRIRVLFGRGRGRGGTRDSGRAIDRISFD